jgi:hypothetical protein
MIVIVNNKKCLAQRFANEMGYTVNSIVFSLIELDDMGNVINKRRISYEGLSIKPGALYVPKKHIVLMNECVDYRIIFHKVTSGNYQYIVKGDDLAIYYKPEVSKAQPSIFTNDSISCERLYKSNTSKRVVFSAFSVLMMAIIFAITILVTDVLKSRTDEFSESNISLSDTMTDCWE